MNGYWGPFTQAPNLLILLTDQQRTAQHLPAGWVQDGLSGDIALFVAASGKRRVLQKYPGSLVRAWKWGAGEGEITFELEPIRVSIE